MTLAKSRNTRHKETLWNDLAVQVIITSIGPSRAHKIKFMDLAQFNIYVVNILLCSAGQSSTQPNNSFKTDYKTLLESLPSLDHTLGRHERLDELLLLCSLRPEMSKAEWHWRGNTCSEVRGQGSRSDAAGSFGYFLFSFPWEENSEKPFWRE